VRGVWGWRGGRVLAWWWNERYDCETLAGRGGGAEGGAIGERDREGGMRILRSLNRRGFSVGTAGYFSVLGQNAWFAASRLTDGFESLMGRSNRETPARLMGPEPRSWVSAEGTTAQPPTLGLIPREHRPLRAAVLACAAGAITLALLWWIMHP
jgi:hypothetical protein